MCNPKDTDKWISCIDTTKELEGIDKAIELTKLALSRSNNPLIRDKCVQLLEEGGHVKESLKRKLANIDAAPLETDRDAVDQIVTDLFFMSEKFEAMLDLKRATRCLEILDGKYPEFLSDEHRVNLLKSMLTVRRLSGVFSVASKIHGVDIDTTSADNQLTFSDAVSPATRRQVVMATAFAAIHLKMLPFISHASFVVHVQELIDLRVEYLAIVNELFGLECWQIAMDLARYLADNTDDVSSINYMGCQIH